MVLAFILQATEQWVSRCTLDEEVAAPDVRSLGASLTVFAQEHAGYIGVIIPS